MSYYIPVVIEASSNGERSYDIYSRLLKDRIIMISGEITEEMSSIIVAELLFLDSQDSKKEIYLYINSPGGSVTAGLAIYDTMSYISPKIITINVGMAASMASLLLAAGDKRYALKNSEIMIHQPLGGTQGQVTDVELQTNRLLRMKDKLIKLMSEFTGVDYDKLESDMERDYFMTPKEAKAYGIIDEILEKKENVLKNKVK